MIEIPQVGRIELTQLQDGILERLKRLITSYDAHDHSAADPSQVDHGDLEGLGDDDHGQYIKDAEYTAKGDILAGTGAGTFAAESVGSNGLVLVADSAEANGVKWVGLAAFLPAPAFHSGLGSPTLGTFGPTTDDRQPSWALDDSSRESVATTWVAPVTGNIDVVAYWAMDTATSGTVYINRKILAMADGEDTNAAGGSANATITVPGTAKYLSVDTLVSSSAVTAGDLVRLTFFRVADSVPNDTASGDLHFIGYFIKYV